MTPSKRTIRISVADFRRLLAAATDVDFSHAFPGEMSHLEVDEVTITITRSVSETPQDHRWIQEISDPLCTTPLGYQRAHIPRTDVTGSTPQ